MRKKIGLNLRLSTSTNIFWDSCVLARWLTDKPIGFKADLSAFLDDAKSGKIKIYHSTILYAEVRPSLLKPGGFSSVTKLIADMQSVLFPVAASAPIMQLAGSIRDHHFRRPDGVRQVNEKDRIMTVPDAIQLATCIHLRDDQGVSDIEFHTYDDGRSRTYEEKAVSLLKLEDYARHLSAFPDVQRAITLPRMKPLRRQPHFPF